MQAYPLPTTFAQAKAEHDYWTVRNQELEDAFSEDGSSLGDNELDLPTAIRAGIVRALAEHELPVSTLADLHGRFAMYRESESNDDTVEAALFRDIETMALREAQASDVTTMPSASSRVHEAGQVEALLRANPQMVGSPDRAGWRVLAYDGRQDPARDRSHVLRPFRPAKWTGLHGRRKRPDHGLVGPDAIV